MPRDILVYLEDIQTAIARIRDYIQAYDFERFQKDFKTIDAVVRNLEIIGEAVKKIPSPLKSQYPSMDWQKIAGLRDMLIHEYFGIDTEILWDIVQTKLNPLSETVSKMTKSL